MNHIYIHCPLLPEEDYRQVLERLCPEFVHNLTVYLHLPMNVTHQDIERVVEVQKAFSENRTVRFQNYGIFEQLPRFGRALCKALRKHSFLLDMRVKPDQAPALVKLAKKLEKKGIAYKFSVEETENQMEIYRRFASCGMHTYFTDPQYTVESPELFDRWLYDPASQGINTFCDIINVLVLQTHSPNCRHASCFGNTFYVDEKLEVFLCPLHRDERTHMGSLRENGSLETLLSCEAVAHLLPAVVQKRQKCADNCDAFASCQGGCPLTREEKDCTCYGTTVEHIRQRLLEVYRDGKVGQVNYIVKNAILNALAFGTAFFS